MLPIARGGANLVVINAANSRSADSNGGGVPSQGHVLQGHTGSETRDPAKNMEEQASSVRAEISAFDSLISRIPMSANLASDIALAAQVERKQGIAHYEEELLILAMARLEKRANFMKLGSLLFFFSLYSTALLLQHSGTDSFNIESSVIMSNVLSSLPQNGFGSSFFNGGAPGSSGLLSSNDDFYGWFRDNIVAVAFKDSVCGDGVCDYPEEVKAVGRFGCAVDCGKVPADTIVSIRVDLKTVMQRRFRSAIDLGDLDPQFRYNIFSKKFNDYVFESPMEPSGLVVRSFEALLTDSLELHLFQVQSLAQKIALSDIQLLYKFGDGTIPERTTPIPWGYGDIREVLAASQYQSQKLQEYCLNRIGDLYYARTNDPVCSDSPVPYPQGFPNYFTPLGMGLQILRSYGITGDITVPSVNEYGKKVLVSLVRPDGASTVGAAVKYCGPLPPSNATVDTLPTGMDFVRLIRRAAADCSTSTRRSWHGDVPMRLPDAPSQHATQPPHEDHYDLESSDSLHDRRTARRLLDDATNPLGLTIGDVGVDDRGFWKCYSGPNDVKLNTKCWVADAQWYFDSYNNSHTYGYVGSLFAAVDVPYDKVSAFQTNSALSAAVGTWKAQGGTAPRLADASLQLRFVVDTSSNFEDAPDCSGLFVPPDGVQAFEYNFKTRLRLWNTNMDQIRVWTCDTRDATATASSVSLLNVTNELVSLQLKPLEPGPFVTLTLPIKDQMSDADKVVLHERLCKVVWTVLDDRCKSRAWTVVTSQASDTISSGRRTSGIWQVRITWLFVSNSRATRASYLITTDINSASFKTQFPIVDFSGPTPFSKVQSPGPLPKLTQTSPYSCLSHYDCDDGLFCSTVSMTTAAQGFRGGGGPGPSGYGCDLCKYCLSDSSDPVDGFCPRDKCGPDTGSYPACVDATKMFAPNFKCKSKYPLYMNRVPPVKRFSNESEQIPLSNPNSTKRKARFLTPYNQLIGSMILTQKRRTGPCILKNDTIAAYSRLKEPQLGAVCRGKQVDNAPFGTDPAFIGYSSLFKGNLEPSNFYSASELDNFSLPFGFFPHSYDQKGRTAKDPKYVWKGEADSFKVYFTERITARHAERFVTYLHDGGFLDQNTESLVLEIPTMNSNLNFFGLYTFTFYWEGGGKVQWDYQIKTFPMYQYDDDTMVGRYFLEFLLIVMLGTNCLSEMYDIFIALKRFDLMSYFQSPWNAVDLAHFALMWAGWSLWLSQVNMSRSLVMPAGFKILASPAPETAARLLATNQDGEYAFLSFVDTMKTLGQNLAMYNYITSMCVLLFVLRLLKVADFQPRIALVTRTLGNAVLDLAHFITLYCMMMLGYAIAGVLMFGHQYEGYKTLTNAIFSLIIVMIAWDPSQWAQLNHAAPDWAFDIFIWSWIFLAVFILLNILLAILVEGYMGVKRMTEELGAPGVIEDVSSVILHEARRVMRYFVKSYQFLSDDELVRRLSRKVGAQHESTLEKAMRDYEAVSLAGLVPIRLQSGETMGIEMVQAILNDLFPERLADSSGGKGSGGGDYFLDPVVKDVVGRYASLKGALDFDQRRKQQLEHFEQLSELDTMRRIARLHLQAVAPEVAALADNPQVDLEMLTLHVTIEKARNLPRMDVGAGVDVFCLIFLEGATGLHRTEVRRGLSEVDWAWDPALSNRFVWLLPKHSKQLDPERSIVVLVYDKDQVSSDDLIGSVKIKLHELGGGAGGEVNGWRRIVRPAGAPKKQFLFWHVPVGEILLRVTLSDGRTPPISRAATAIGNVASNIDAGSSSVAQGLRDGPAGPMEAVEEEFLPTPVSRTV